MSLTRVIRRADEGRRRDVNRSQTMRKWKTPKVIEIAVGMEINSYACAEL